MKKVFDGEGELNNMTTAKVKASYELFSLKAPKEGLEKVLKDHNITFNAMLTKNEKLRAKFKKLNLDSDYMEIIKKYKDGPDFIEDMVVMYSLDVRGLQGHGS